MVVASNQIRISRTDVEKGSMRTLFVHGLFDPKIYLYIDLCVFLYFSKGFGNNNRQIVGVY